MSLLKEILYGLAGGAFGAFPLSFSGLASLAGHFTGIETQTDGLAALCVIGGTALAFLLRYFRKIGSYCGPERRGDDPAVCSFDGAGVSDRQ